MSTIAEFDAVDARRLREEIAPRHAPAVLRRVVAHWPAVSAACSTSGIAAYLRPLDNGAKQMAR